MGNDVFEKGETPCFQKHKEGYLCTRKRAHSGEHYAHDLRGNVIRKWRGGKPYWAPDQVAVKAVAR